MNTGGLEQMIALVLAGGGSGVLCKIVWDWLKSGRTNGNPRKAGEMPVTHDELGRHCTARQQNCTRILETSFNAAISEVRIYLQQGRDHFDRLDKSLDGVCEEIKGLRRELNNHAAAGAGKMPPPAQVKSHDPG